MGGLRNEHRIVGNMVAVKPLRNVKDSGHRIEFLVDVDVWRKLPWSGWVVNSNGYVNSCGVALHQVVCYLNGVELPWGMVVDHMNRNRLDCRICNLRVCTPIQNSWNSEKRHGHQLKSGKWRFTFSKSYPTMAEAELGLANEGFQYMSKNRTCFTNETFDTYEEGYQWWRYQAGIHYGDFSPFAHPYKTCDEIIKEACACSTPQLPS